MDHTSRLGKWEKREKWKRARLESLVGRPFSILILLEAFFWLYWTVLQMGWVWLGYKVKKLRWRWMG